MQCARSSAVNDWTAILADAQALEKKLRKAGVDLNEAQKVGEYYVGHAYDDTRMASYLALLAANPPIRSRQSQRYFVSLRDIWKEWQPKVSGRAKAQAWAWGVRLAKSPEI
jgi:hypothetical protein